MKITREDFVAKRRAQIKERERSHIPNLQLLEQAAVDAESLTGTPQWDVYLQFIQDNINKANQLRDEAAALLTNPEIVSDEDMRRAKLQHIKWSTVATTLETVITLPKIILEQGGIAKDLIAEFSEDADDEKS